MNLHVLGTCIAAFTVVPLCSAAEKPQVRPDWAHFFTEASAVGTILVADERTDGEATGVCDEARAGKRYPPASTFKIPHALFALDAGVVRDEFQIFKWEGKGHRALDPRPGPALVDALLSGVGLSAVRAGDRDRERGSLPAQN